jgi:hypothetical protein
VNNAILDVQIEPERNMPDEKISIPHIEKHLFNWDSKAVLE